MVFIYVILLILALLIGIVMFLSVEIHIDNIRFSSKKIEKTYLNKNYKIIISLKLFDKISILRLNINKDKMDKMKILKKIEKNVSKNANKSNSGFLKYLKLLKASRIENLDLEVEIGIEDAAINAILVGVVSSIVPLVLRNNVEASKAFWKVEPIYNQNLLIVKLDTTINLKLTNILFHKSE